MKLTLAKSSNKKSSGISNLLTFFKRGAKTNYMDKGTNGEGVVSLKELKKEASDFMNHINILK